MAVLAFFFASSPVDVAYRRLLPISDKCRDIADGKRAVPRMPSVLHLAQWQQRAAARWRDVVAKTLITVRQRILSCGDRCVISSK